jgi:hypothetical protein
MIEIESELFARLTRAKSLPHPTARNFDSAKWLDAIKELDAPSTRDQQLLEAALHFGHEIQSLRHTFESRLFDGIDRRTGILLSIAMANYNFLTLTKHASESIKKKLPKGGVISVGGIGRNRLEARTQAVFPQ